MSTDDNRDRAASEPVYLELSDGKSHKFYETTVNGTEIIIRYGRIGTTGQSSSTTYATAETAQAEAAKKINEKLKKGYIKLSSGSDLPTPSMPQVLRDLPPQFEPLRSFLEANLVPYINFTATEVGHLNSVGYRPSDWGGDPLELWQSKIGGHPYLPKDMSYPTDVTTGQMMMFLMQVDCADLPIVDGLNLPRQGLLQFYIGLVAMCELSPEQHRVLYFPETSKDKNDLITDFSFLAEPADAMEWYDNVYALRFSTHRDVFWAVGGQLPESLQLYESLEFPEHLMELREDFEEWIADYEDRCSGYTQSRGGRVNKLGGYPELHSYVNEILEGVRGRLLLELNHDFGENFYFYIEDSDLVNLSFNRVESYAVWS
jgi:uncharacterized protein YwqG/predicted DNA-binding WGR domain protein